MYQVSKEVVQKLELGDVAVMQFINNLQYRDRYFNTDWQFEMFNRCKDNGHGTWYKCKFKKVFLFSVTNVVGTHWNCFKCVPTTYVFFNK